MVWLCIVSLLALVSISSLFLLLSTAPALFSAVNALPPLYTFVLSISAHLTVLFAFVALVIVRVTVPRNKLESVSRLSWFINLSVLSCVIGIYLFVWLL